MEAYKDKVNVSPALIVNSKISLSAKGPPIWAVRRNADCLRGKSFYKSQFLGRKDPATKVLGT